MASDRDDGTLTYRWSSDGGGAFDDDEALVTPWFAPRATAANERLVLTLTVTDSTNASASATASVTVRANQAPRVTVSPSTARVDGEEVLAVSGSATDPEGDRLTFAWSSNGGGSFDDAGASDTTWTAPATTADVQNITLTLTVTDDGAGRLKHAAEVRVTVPGNTPPPDPITSGGGGGGGGGGGPSPSVVDFEWTVSRDIDELGGGHDKPSGTWSDGATLWVLENGDGADDAIYAYDLATGERVEDREFELDETNRAPRGVWSDRTVLWVSDSGQERSSPTTLRPASASLSATSHSPTATAMRAASGPTTGRCGCSTVGRRASSPTTSRAASRSRSTPWTTPTTTHAASSSTASPSGSPTTARSGSSPTGSRQGKTARTRSSGTATRSSPTRC